MKFSDLVWKNKTTALFALFSSLGLSVFLYSSWLAPSISFSSKRVILYALIIGIVGTVAYFLSIQKALRLFQQFDFYTKAIVFIIIFIVGISIFYKADNIIDKKAYFSPLLPEQKLEIYVPTTADSSNDHTITWITTSIGEVSYDSIDYTGWTKDKGLLSFRNTSQNTFLWEGKTGDKATIVFLISEHSNKIYLWVNGVKEELDFSSEARGEYFYHKNFYVPWYASRELILMLGVYQTILLSFLVSTFPIGLYLDKIIKKYSNTNYINSFPSSKQKNNKVNKQEIGIVIGFVLFALALRIFNLENLDPYVDEQAHLIAANSILKGTSLGDVYQRSLWIVTLPVTLAFKLFGNELWAARLPGVLFNALAIIPLYLLTKKTNKTIAVFSVFLYATSPWIVATARNTREYAFYPFYFYWIAFALVKILEWLPKNLSLKLVGKELTKHKRWLIILLLFFPILYIKTDTYSTFKLVMLVYIIFFLFLGIRIVSITRKKPLHQATLLIILLMLSVPIIFPYLGLLQHLSFRYYPTTIFLSNPHQWYFQRTLIIPSIILISSLLGTIIFGKRNQLLYYIWVLFGTSYFFFSFIFARYFRPRYVIFMEYWFLIVMAIDFYMTWLFLKEVFSRKIASIIMFFMFLVFLNPLQTLEPSLNPKLRSDGMFYITEEWHLRNGEVDLFFQDKDTKNSVLLATVYGSHLQWQNKTDKFKTFFGYGSGFYLSENSTERIESIAKENDRGWLVLDITRAKFIAIPKDNFVFDDTQFEFFGRFGDHYIWGWGTNDE